MNQHVFQLLYSTIVQNIEVEGWSCNCKWFLFVDILQGLATR